MPSSALAANVYVRTWPWVARGWPLPDWNVFAVTHFVVAVALGALAWVTYAARPQVEENRRLAVLFACTAAIFFSVGGLYSSTDPRVTLAWTGTTMSFWFASVPLTLHFLGVLDSPLARPFRGRVTGWLLVALAFGSPFLWFASRDVFVTGAVPFAPYVPYRPLWTSAFDHYNRFLAGLSTYAVLVTLTAFARSAPGTVRRKQLAAYATAAVTTDILTVARMAWLSPHVADLTRAGIRPPDWEVRLFLFAAVASYAAFILLMAYGILKSQVFDIDLKIKVGVRRSTVAAAFVGVFFVASQVAEQFLTSSYGLLAGGASAGVLLLALGPLQRLAGRVADTAMPNVHETDEYAAYRKLEVYRGALEEMLADGDIVERDRKVLDGLRRRLGIGEEAAGRLETDVRRVLAA